MPDRGVTTGHGMGKWAWRGGSPEPDSGRRQTCKHKRRGTQYTWRGGYTRKLEIGRNAKDATITAGSSAVSDEMASNAARGAKSWAVRTVQTANESERAANRMVCNLGGRMREPPLGPRGSQYKEMRKRADIQRTKT